MFLPCPSQLLSRAVPSVFHSLCKNTEHIFQGDHSPDNVKFPDDSLTVRGTRHVKCYSYHARTSVTVSGGGRNATVHDSKPYKLT